ncbi:MAG: hypothetical protein FWH34_04745, partial [Desulfovibrionaceae bacterium]|nr:hypothetical protein [Desulfovibrionaceae bacterium]
LKNHHRLRRTPAKFRFARRIMQLRDFPLEPALGEMPEAGDARAPDASNSDVDDIQELPDTHSEREQAHGGGAAAALAVSAAQAY